MKYRKVKKNGDEISILGYGCMRFPTKFGIINEEKAEAQIKYALNHGVNYFDTAYPYHAGASEKFLGKLISKGTIKRDENYITTKLPPFSVKTKEDMEKIFQEQLTRLKTEYVDYYLLHGITDSAGWHRMLELGVLDFFDRIKNEGRAYHIGFSFHSHINLFKEMVDAYDWDICQIQYNFLDETIQAGTEGLEYAYDKGISVFIMEPLRGGSLAGEVPKKVQSIWDEVSGNPSAARLALQWLWNQKEVTCVLSGMNDDEHIQENIESANESSINMFNNDTLEKFDRVKKVYQESTKVPCTGCSYCLPCPAKVNIPLAFQNYNNMFLFDAGIGGKIFYQTQLGGIMNEELALASQCINCNKCVEHCPQHIDIPKELKKVADYMEGPMDKPLRWLLNKVL
jgi:hypothetical protein